MTLEARLARVSACLLCESRDVLKLNAQERLDEPLNDSSVGSKSTFFQGKLFINLLDNGFQIYP